MDVIALAQYDLPIGIATCGTALTTQHTKLITRHTEECIFAFDNDAAGFDAIIRGLKVAYAQDLFPKVLQFPPEYKDVDEWLTAHPFADTPAAKAYLHENSIDGFTHVLRHLQSRYDLMNPVERKKIGNICFELFSNIEDRSILTLYLDQMSKVFSTGSDILMKQFKSFLKKQRVRNFQPVEEEQKESSMAPKYLLASLRYSTSTVEELLAHSSAGQLQKIYTLIQQLSTHFPESLIQRIQDGSLNETEGQYLLEAQLRWEHQFGDLAIDKKVSVLQHFLQQQLHTLERLILKSKNISHEEKQAIMQQVREVKRG